MALLVSERRHLTFKISFWSPAESLFSAQKHVALISLCFFKSCTVLATQQASLFWGYPEFGTTENILSAIIIRVVHITKHSPHIFSSCSDSKACYVSKQCSKWQADSGVTQYLETEHYGSTLCWCPGQKLQCRCSGPSPSSLRNQEKTIKSKSP